MIISEEDRSLDDSADITKILDAIQGSDVRKSGSLFPLVDAGIRAWGLDDLRVQSGPGGWGCARLLCG